MTFNEVCAECISNDALVKQFNRLTGYRLGISKAPIITAIDKACGYDPDAEAIPAFVDFIWNYIWVPLSDKSQKEKPCPYCQSVKNEWGTCSWHCVTWANIDKNCLNECNYKHREDVKDE
jgi:hypothetical protein